MDDPRMIPRTHLVQSPVFISFLIRQACKYKRPETVQTSLDANDVRMGWVYRKREDEIAHDLGGWPIILPYSDEVARSASDTDVDHIVPIKEAIESGATNWTRDKWREFQSDKLNLMLALPHINRHDKGCRDISEWIPPKHQFWYVMRFTLVKISYGLSFDEEEIRVIYEVLSLHSKEHK